MWAVRRFQQAKPAAGTHGPPAGRRFSDETDRYRGLAVFRRLRNCNSFPNRPAAYSLAELLIVLAVLVTVTALAVPNLRPMLSKARLRGSGNEITAALGKARALAIRSGNRTWFRYQPEGNQWEITGTPLPLPPFGQAGERQENSTELSDFPATRDAPDQSPPSTEVILRQGTLPAGITFADAGDSSTDAWANESANTLEEAAESREYTVDQFDDAAPESHGVPSTTIEFLPDGRTQNASIILNGGRGFYVRIDLRGLTGIAGASAPLRSSAGLRTDPTNSPVNSDTASATSISGSRSRR